MSRRGLYHLLVANGALLAVVALSWLLVGMKVSEPGLAAPVTSQNASSVAQSQIGATTVGTSTVFLPLVTYQEVAVNIWQAEYYDNIGLLEPPAYTAEEARIDYDWGEDGPPGLADNYFSIRWTGSWEFETGEYTFSAYSDDGMRLWLDEELLIDAWTAGMGDHEATRHVDAGVHELKLEYFERTGDAAVHLLWRRTDLYPQWHGDYYNEPWVESGRQYSQIDRGIQFDWGEDCPERLPPSSCNKFSISWETTPLFEPGLNRIHIYADEGYQLYVDGNWVQEGGWELGQEGGAEDDWYDLDITGSELEYHEITYNFHDQGGPAEARLWIEMVYPEWTAEYYNNRNLSGDPVRTDNEAAIFYDWGLDKPRQGVNSDDFSVRWTGQRYFHSGCYRFGVFSDDGVRLWVDGELLVDHWNSGRAEYHSPATYLSSGYHDLVVEYFEGSGEAEVRLWWE